jgi:formylglycine-generating enzyme required for sulfatase activity
MSQGRYTAHPRAILWLVRGGETIIEGPVADARSSFPARVESFYLSKTPITNLQFEAYEPALERSPTSPDDDDPVVGVDFQSACGYCEWYARVSRKPIRLPTEVEWEYACRGGSRNRCFFGDDPIDGDDYVWHGRNSGGRMRPQHEKKPNPFGLLGMLGGVWEWTSSLYLPYPVVDGDGRDDTTSAGPRVLRGGSFREPPEQIGSGTRRAAEPDLRRDDVGFRIARTFKRDPTGATDVARSS